MATREDLRNWVDARFGRASTSVVSLPAYALAIASAALALHLWPMPSTIAAVFLGMIVATLVIYAVAVLFDNASIYDPFWSVAPPVIVAYLAFTSGPPESWPARLWLVAAIVLAWALRLTWNCMARWPRLDGEDFRYRNLRAASGRWFWLVNLTGIELFPTLLVFLGCLPLHTVAVSSHPLGWLDVAATALALAAIALEAVADRQLTAHRRGPRRGTVLTTGVWTWSQHPNYLGELSFWWALLLFGLAAGAPLWTAIGALAMTVLFRFISVRMMVARKRAHHPDYDTRVSGIPLLLPRPPRRR